MRLAELAKEISMTEDGESISWPYNVTTAEKRLTEALLRIEQLEAALRRIVAMTPDPEFGAFPINSAIDVARAALEGRDDKL